MQTHRKHRTFVALFILFSSIFLWLSLVSPTYAKTGISINTLSPFSTTQYEYIELYNNSSSPVDISGWSIYDSSSTCTKNSTKTVPSFDANTSILPFTTFTITLTSPKLNNDKEKVYLYDKDNNLIDSWGYGGGACEDANPTNSKNITLTDPDTIGRVPKGGDQIIKNPNNQTTSTPTPSTTIPVTSTLISTTTTVVSTTIIPSTSVPFTTAVTTSAPPTDYQQIKINEIQPYNVSTTDTTQNEWIELYNNSMNSIDLENLSLVEYSSCATISSTTKLSGTIAAHGFAVFNIANLNDGGDKIQLKYLSEEIDTITYGSCGTTSISKNLSLGRFPDGSTEITLLNLTKNSSNTKAATSTVTNTTSTGVVDSETDTENILTTEEVKELEDGEEIIIRGVITAEPNILGKNTFYVQDTTGGIKIFGEIEDKITKGDLVTIKGTVNKTKTDFYIIPDTIIDSAKGILPKPQTVELKDITEDLSGKLVFVHGKITKNNASSFEISDGKNKLLISIAKSTGIKKPKLKTGELIEIIGIVDRYTVSGKEYIRVLPRYQTDINPSQAQALVNTGEVTIINVSIGCLILILTLLIYIHQFTHRNKE